MMKAPTTWAHHRRCHFITPNPSKSLTSSLSLFKSQLKKKTTPEPKTPHHHETPPPPPLANHWSELHAPPLRYKIHNQSNLHLPNGLLTLCWSNPSSIIPIPYATDTCDYPIPCRHVICKATQILLNNHNQSHPATSSSSPFLNLFDYLNSLSLPLTPTEASEILKSLNHPSLILSFFWSCPSISLNQSHYKQLEWLLLYL